MKHLCYEGSAFLRQRLLLSTLTGQPVRISQIRAAPGGLAMPGLRPYEASLLRLLCKVTAGTRVHIDATGTVLTYVPGQLLGSDEDNPDSLVHVCHPGRGLSYYLDVLLLLAPFCKNPLSISLSGVTDGSEFDPPVDLTRSVTVPTLHRLLSLVANRGVGAAGGGAPPLSFELKLIRRGFPPAGGGEVSLRCSGVLSGPLQPFTLVETGRIKRVRGVAFAENVNPLLARRCINRIRHVFNAFLPDVWVYLDVKKKGAPEAHAREKRANTEKRRGVGVTLVAETISGNFKGAFACEHSQEADDSKRKEANEGATEAADVYRATGNCKLARLLEQEARENTEEHSGVLGEGTEKLGQSEQMGEHVAHRLLLEIMQGGVVDTNHQYVALLFAAAAEEHQPSKLRLSRLTPYTTQFLRHLRDFLGVTFHFEETDAETTEVLLKCVGVGLRNTARKTF
ncbi:putative RNA 3' terminal phosphate cyclase [Neospora caninum Liverpool]|uniref:Putative RNA 3' terminal phosphate cyclase n=1 Tax=Neospora caninum (strain Liverpool) TaxID=572307 RepID=F0VI89_NEOCL|nr:putative RNA 3' terminal phosphate cyclase [Neospora caninum Liverpool]CBZ53450.1 putative RNA 3' terminal phosphate cyclase [Neospora caninum Liverpool]CEL67437.1 TPA: rna 3' terminal phosphate cyclase, putative [Neospora caninum Liverpool]|eukprot:XP_003883482.1 putative RNA 3' terminal phosphate cyclase [Neospora caninum Liverpool]